MLSCDYCLGFCCCCESPQYFMDDAVSRLALLFGTLIIIISHLKCLFVAIVQLLGHV